MITKLRHDLDNFWFSLIPATSLGLFRIVFGILVVCWCLLIAPDLRTWYSESGLLTLSSVKVWNGNPYAGALLLAKVTDFRITIALFSLLVLSAICMTTGFCTRVATIICFICLASFHERALMILNGGDTLMRNMLFLMMFADSGAALSIDRLIRIAQGKEPAISTPRIEAWPQRLMQLQLSAVYLSTVFSKISGSDWQSGTAVYYALHLTDLTRFPLHGLENNPLFYIAGTYFTLVAEFALALMPWSRRLFPYWVVLALVLHLGIEYMMNVPLFEYIILSCLALFVPQESAESCVEFFQRQFSRYRVSVPQQFIDQSGLGKVLLACDLFRLITPTDDLAISSVNRNMIIQVLFRLPIVWCSVFGIPLLLVMLLNNFLIADGIAAIDLVTMILVVRMFASSVLKRLSRNAPKSVVSIHA